MDRYRYLFLLLLLCVASCTAPQDSHRAYCNFLKSQMMFAGSTSEDRKADIQESETPLLKKAYEDSHCDEY